MYYFNVIRIITHLKLKLQINFQKKQNFFKIQQNNKALLVVRLPVSLLGYRKTSVELVHGGFLFKVYSIKYLFLFIRCLSIMRKPLTFCNFHIRKPEILACFQTQLKSESLHLSFITSFRNHISSIHENSLSNAILLFLVSKNIPAL